MTHGSSKLPREEELEVLLRDPDFTLDLFAQSFADDGNPYYAFMAIGICRKHGKQFPDWVNAYLDQVVERMELDEAKETDDLREVLPKIFGFPKRRGPGKLLNPGDNHKRILFAMKFKSLLFQKGQEPKQAMANAYNAIFDGKNDNVDDRTLQRWLREEFSLSKLPSTTQEWKKILYDQFHPLAVYLRAHLEKQKSRETLP